LSVRAPAVVRLVVRGAAARTVRDVLAFGRWRAVRTEHNAAEKQSTQRGKSYPSEARESGRAGPRRPVRGGLARRKIAGVWEYSREIRAGFSP
jgi:hypothetical protein